MSFNVSDTQNGSKKREFHTKEESIHSNCCCDAYVTIRHDRYGKLYRALVCFNNSRETGVNVQCEFFIYYSDRDEPTKVYRRNYVKPGDEWEVASTYDIDGINYEVRDIYCVPVN